MNEKYYHHIRIHYYYYIHNDLREDQSAEPGQINERETD